MNVSIVEITEPFDDALSALNKLLPQLSVESDPVSCSDFEQIVRLDTTHLYMAKSNIGYVGALTLVIFRIPSGLRAWIEDVVVSEEARGLGVGQLLVEHAVAAATAAQVKSIDLTSRSTRVPAIALYKKLGFVDRETTVFRHASE